MRAASILFAMVSMVSVGCGGGGIAGEPLIRGEVTGDFEGVAFTPAFGFARDITDDNPLDAVLEIFLGDAPISCADDFMGPPRTGTYAVIYLTGNRAGTYDSTLVQLTRVTEGGDLSGAGSSTASVDITTSATDRIAATVSYEDTLDGNHYSLAGDLEVFRCPD